MHALSYVIGYNDGSVVDIDIITQLVDLLEVVNCNVIVESSLINDGR